MQRLFFFSPAKYPVDDCFLFVSFDRSIDLIEKEEKEKKAREEREEEEDEEGKKDKRVYLGIRRIKVICPSFGEKWLKKK